MPERQRNNLTIYDDVAGKWWTDEIRWVRVLRNMVPGRLAWFDPRVAWQGKRVLDLGCAGGFMAEALVARGARVTGIDPATDAIAAARTHAADQGHDIRYDVGIGEDLPYEDGAFDAVVSVDVLEHVQDLGQVCREVARVLSPGGTFCFDTIDRNPVSRFAAITLAEDLFKILPKGTHDPEMFVTRAELRTALDAAGLEWTESTGLGPRGINGRGDPTFGPLPFRSVIYMGIASKR